MTSRFCITRSPALCAENAAELFGACRDFICYFSLPFVLSYVMLYTRWKYNAMNSMTGIITPVFELMRKKTMPLIDYTQFYYVYTELSSI